MNQLARSLECRNPLHACRRAIMRACLLALALSSVASAQSSATTDASRNASARALFEEGVALAEQSDWIRAEDRFRRALNLRASPVIMFNLASVLVDRGILIEARELLLRVTQDDKIDPGMRDSARKLLADASARIGRISVNVQGLGPGDVVFLDGTELLDAQLNVEIPADPGAHQLRLLRAGKALVARLVNVEPGGTQRVLLMAPTAPAPPRAVARVVPVPKPKVVPAAPPTPREVAKVAVTREPRPFVAAPLSASEAPPTAAQDSERPVTRTWWFWTGVGVVAAAVVTAAVVVVANGSSSKPASAYRGDFAPTSLPVEVSR